MVSTSPVEDQTTAASKLKADRYIASNRFTVRQGREAKFEKRWATRKSRLASLDGFKYFHLMRRVNLETGEYEGGVDSASAFGNYVSFTIWNNKGAFNAWRKGDAFKEAHGGTSIGAFVSTMVNSALVLRGAPKPAFYDGLMLQSMKPESLPNLQDGWRVFNEEIEGVLPAECFVACNQFFVPSENAVAFEQRWANRKSLLKECDGFVAFSMLRRDGNVSGHGTSPMTEDEPTYVSIAIWRDRDAFDSWRTGSNFKAAHGQKPDEKKPEGSPPAPLWSKPPSPIFYEGKLVITSEDGA